MKKSIVRKIKCWWNRRSFYVDIQEAKKLSLLEKTTENTPEPDSPDQTIKTDSSDDSNPDFDTTTICSPGEGSGSDAAKSSPTNKPLPLDIDQLIGCFPSAHSCTSLCSIDSLADSYWDPYQHDDSHQLPGDDFFFEHVRFLRIHTAPHQVEVVWSPNNGPPIGGHSERVMFEV